MLDMQQMDLLTGDTGTRCFLCARATRPTYEKAWFCMWFSGGSSPWRSSRIEYSVESLMRFVSFLTSVVDGCLPATNNINDSRPRPFTLLPIFKGTLGRFDRNFGET